MSVDEKDVVKTYKHGWIKTEAGLTHYVDNIVHNENGYAFINNNGDKFYLQNGLLHREAGPAVEKSNGIKLYFKNGSFVKLEK